MNDLFNTPFETGLRAILILSVIRSCGMTIDRLSAYDFMTISIDITCVPNQWMNYQLFVAQITRAYYLDMPEKYRELNDRFPKIHVKEFGEYFHESEHLFD